MYSSAFPSAIESSTVLPTFATSTAPTFASTAVPFTTSSIPTFATTTPYIAPNITSLPSYGLGAPTQVHPGTYVTRSGNLVPETIHAEATSGITNRKTKRYERKAARREKKAQRKLARAQRNEASAEKSVAQAAEYRASAHPISSGFGTSTVSSGRAVANTAPLATTGLMAPSLGAPLVGAPALGMGTAYPGMSLGGIPFTTKSWVESGATTALGTSGFPMNTASSTVNSLMTKGSTAIASRAVPGTTMLV